MTLDIQALHPVVAAEIRGLDLSRPLDDAIQAEVRSALDRHQVLVFHGQPLDQDRMLAFASRFGQPEVFVDASTAQGKVPTVLRLTNLDPQTNQPIGPGPDMARMSLAENWHSDSSYRAVPAYTTLLHGVEIPGQGGDTQFTSMHAAYDALPDALKQKIEPLSAIHSWAYQRTLSPGRKPMTDQERLTAPDVPHRLVQRHPDTGRKLLYISSSAHYIEGMPFEEGRALLQELKAIATQPEAIYTHKWQPGDLVMWDNRATLHRAGGFDYQSTTLRRLLHRIVIGGDAAAYQRAGQQVAAAPAM